MNNLAEEAYKELFPNYPEYRNIEVNYSSKFKSLNANVKYDSHKIHFFLSRDWLEFSSDLKIGLIQHLLLKVFTRREFERTFELDLYEKFVENIGKYTKIKDVEEELLESFNRVNIEYFNSDIERPNIIWGNDAFSKLGHYEYASNEIVISNIFKGQVELLDYIMYHELLHKKHGFRKTASGRSMHHTKEFKADEAKFKIKDIEKKLKWFIRKKRIKEMFF